MGSGTSSTTASSDDAAAAIYLDEKGQQVQPTEAM